MSISRSKRQRNKLYGLVRRTQHGIEAMIDASTVSMGISREAINLWNSPPEHYLAPGWFIVRINSKDCPISVSLNRRWPARPRNFCFTEKD